MGMFDSFYDANGNEWQTKAFGKNLDQWSIGDSIPTAPIDHQVMVFGGLTDDAEPEDSFATIRSGRVVEVPAERDQSLPLLDYNGTWVGGN